ncbi:MAG: tRNA threonylcarbamoyladenosine dehydratase [Clostridia bacterium]|nr:tRNA threonylcarbamoyladenosine dehydratase [Clostridia bacterium]
MEEKFSRTALLLGENGVERLKNSRVAVFGVGGVGSFTVEALARLGIGHITLVDPDKVVLSNLNRQLVALHSTLGMYKVDVAKARILDINPEAEVEVLKMFYLPENADEFDVSRFDCIVDAIDTVSAKLELIVRAKKAGVHIVSSMGTGNKLHPEMLEISDISKTSVCPLARVMRRELRARGIEHLDVVYSKEEAMKPREDIFLESGKKTVGSVSFVPSAAGILLASRVCELILSE